MKRITFIIVFLFLSFPANAQVNNGVPLETVVTLKGYPYTPIISTEIDKAILLSSNFCPFIGQSYRVRLVLDVTWDYKTNTYNYKAEWFTRVDGLSNKFDWLDTQTGSWKLSEERKMAVWFLDHTDELMEELLKTSESDDEYNDYSPETIYY